MPFATAAGAPLALGQLAVRRRWGPVQEAFLPYGAPLVLGFLLGSRWSMVVPAPYVEAAVGRLVLSGFLALGMTFVGIGVGHLAVRVRARRRRSSRGVQVAGPSDVDEQMSGGTALGVALLGSGLLAMAASGIAAALGIAGASWHDLGPTMTPVILGGLAIVLVAVIPVLAGRRRTEPPGPDMG